MISLSEIAVSQNVAPSELAESLSPTLKKTLLKKKTPQISSTLGLARLLGLSEWTVSRAINGHPEVKAATRERILKAMDEVGFRPNPVARGLSGKGMGIVGVSFGMARNVLMMEKITILDEFLRENDLRGVLAICPPDVASQVRILEDFRHLRVDGVVLVQSYIPPSELRKMLVGVRCVHVDSPPDDLGPRVWLDRVKAFRMIIDHLWDLGHRSFGVLGFSASDYWRWKGVTEALQARGVPAEESVQTFELPDRGLESYAEGIQLAQMALASRPHPTAFIAVNDQVAVGAIQSFHDRGLKVPGDVSVVGFGNFEVGRHLRPRLTTIDQRPELMMRMAGQNLLTQLKGIPDPMAETNTIIEPLLVVRDSTGVAPQA